MNDETILNLPINFKKLTKNSDIEHLGRIESIKGDLIKVNFITQSACASCHAKGACSAADMQEKEVEIISPGFHAKKGEQVWVVLKQSLGFRALFLGYILPLILLLVVLLSFTPIFGSEGKAGLAALAALVFYYSGLYLFRNKIDKQFNFTLRKIN